MRYCIFRGSKRMKRRLIAAALACCFLFLTVGCRKNGPIIVTEPDVSSTLPPHSGSTQDVSPFATICEIPQNHEALREAAMAGKNYGESYLSFRTDEEVGSYLGEDCAIYIRRVSYGMLTGKITAYVADVYIENISQLVGHVLTDENGKYTTGTPERAIAETGALLLLNTDFVSARKWGLYVRGGKLWKDRYTDGIDVCAIGRDGKMKILDGDTIDSEKILADENLYHILTFGPSLLNEDGSPRDENGDFRIGENYSYYNVTTGVGFLAPNPRSAIGQAEDGHFILVAVDGRDKGYSKGMTFPELSHLMYEEGAAVAYNLDGGGSVYMYFNGRQINANGGNPREPSDYFCVVKKD